MCVKHVNLCSCMCETDAHVCVCVCVDNVIDKTVCVTESKECADVV